MKQFKDTLWEWIFFINKLAILVLIAFGIDYISSKYNIPWQIIFIVIISLFLKEQFAKKKKNKENNHSRKNKLYSILGEEVFNSLTPTQILDIDNIISNND